MQVISKRIQQKPRLGLHLGISCQNQEDIEPKSLIEQRVEILLASHQHSSNDIGAILIHILVVKLTKACHLFLQPFILHNIKLTVFEI